MGFLDNIKNINFFGGGGGVVGIDIGSSAIKVVELESRSGKAYLKKYGTLALGPYSKKDIGTPVKISTAKTVEALKAALELIGVTSKNGGIAVPLKVSLIVTIEVPESARDRLEQIVPIEARKYIPVSPSEINIAWTILSGREPDSMSNLKNEGNDQKIKILVAAIHNTTIANYQDISTQIGLQGATLEIETFSAIRSTGEEKGVTALLDIGSLDSKIVINDSGSISSSHTIDKGSHALTDTLTQTLGITYKEAEKMKRSKGLNGRYKEKSIKEILMQDVEYIFSDTKRAIDGFEKEHKKKVSKIVLIGGGSMLGGIVEVGKGVTGKEIIQGNAFSKVKLPTKALEQVLRVSGPEYAVALGIALRLLDE